MRFIFLAFAIILFICAFQQSSEQGYVLLNSNKPAIPLYHAGLASMGYSISGGLCCIAAALCRKRGSII